MSISCWLGINVINVSGKIMNFFLGEVIYLVLYLWMELDFGVWLFSSLLLSILVIVK